MGATQEMEPNESRIDSLINGLARTGSLIKKEAKTNANNLL
jgi:hypothetical protein